MSYRNDILWDLYNLNPDVLLELLVDLDRMLEDYDFTRRLIFRLLDNQKTNMEENTDIIYRVRTHDGTWLETSSRPYTTSRKVYTLKGARLVAKSKGAVAQRGYVQWEDIE